MLIAFVYLIFLVAVAKNHTIATYGPETDFYDNYAPEAISLANLKLPNNFYQGPGYPTTLALTMKLTGSDIFILAKWVSIISATITILLVFLLFKKLFGYFVGISSMLLVMISGQFPVFAISATPDIFLLMLFLAALVIFLNDQLKVSFKIIVTAIITILAYLTRSNGIFISISIILGIIGINLFNHTLKKRLKLTILFVTCLFLAILPWFLISYHNNSSAFYNRNYLNIATEFYPELSSKDFYADSLNPLNIKFHSFKEVLSYDPLRILKHYPISLFQILEKTIMTSYFSSWPELVNPWIGVLGVAGIVFIVIRRPSKKVFFVITTTLIYLLLMAFTHFETRYYFFMMVVYVGFAVYIIYSLSQKLIIAKSLKNLNYLIPTTLILVFWLISLFNSAKEVQSFLLSQPKEILKACTYFQEKNIQNAIILSRKPHLSYLCHQQLNFMPKFKSIEDLHSWLKSNSVDYIAIGPPEISSRPELASLKNPQNAPSWLKPVWMNAELSYILYKPERVAENEQN